MEQLRLEIITPKKMVYDNVVKSVTIPGSIGSFQVLNLHAPLLSSFEIGVIKVVDDSGEKHFATSGGTAEVLDNKVLILAETLEAPQEIDIERAKESEKRARERLKLENRQKEVDALRAELALKRALNRIKISAG
ncbi:MAG: F0F1 ATP synthase subunit epsilon [Melioribacteraceae bacterium]|nr:F0F1 ATP synthase subunit epsilon [Melioribacteraceae bacterium]MCF8263937.1 F0F1 ATP synthase subunit epsilon [Melioribacteraceae bacterium]MCF8412306.1 F0F1 ATP synthase subunit epsilon [Melioribacteraceae bacterium]